LNLYADLLFTGRRIYTADPTYPWCEAVAVRGNRILAVGQTTELAELRGPQTEVIALGDRLLLPGFTESHVHLIELALRAGQVNATAAPSAAAVAARVAERVVSRPAGGWIRGGGWDANLWAVGERPHRALLDAVTGNVPVALDSKDLHSVWLNSAALRHVGIRTATPDVHGGVIERDAHGEPTGVLRDNAINLIRATLPQPDLAETTTAVRAAIPALWRSGLSAIHNASDTLDGLALRTCQALRGTGDLGLRVLQQMPAGNLSHARTLGLRSGLGDPWLRIGGIKIFADGALGSRTALMLEPYEGEPDNRGVATTAAEELLAQALDASAAGLSLTIHAIGDRANRDVLDVLAEVRRREIADCRLRIADCPGQQPNPKSEIRNPKSVLRHRIEHVQCIHPDDLPRLAQLGVIASVQPIHATSDMALVDCHWGSLRARSAYPFRSLLASGARLIFGSDGPVEPHAPLIGIHAAVTRRRSDGTPGPEGWQGQERVTVAEAVDAYTCWPAYAAGEESYRGRIRPGYVADLAVLSQDIFTIDPMAILETRVEITVVDGKIRWSG